jgi:predicted metalloprotease
MRREQGRRSNNIEDRRGMGVGKKGLVGGGIGTIVLARVAMYFGVAPSVAINQAGNLAPTQQEQQQATLTRRRNA